METRTLDSLDVAGKRVFVRVDFNVPLDERQHITDETRMVAAVPTIASLVARGAKVILASHLGRPKGRPAPEFSLRPVAERLAVILGHAVAFAPDCVGPDATKAVAGCE